MNRIKFFLLLFSCITLLSRCRKPADFSEENFDERFSGGSQTAFDNSSKAFSHEFNDLTNYDLTIHEIGDAGFEQTFVTAPAPFNSGLGPAFNNVSCISCHHNDGRGVPTVGSQESALLIRISLPGSGRNGDAIAVPGYGTQIQDNAIFGVAPECKIVINYTYQSYSFADGESYEIRTPTYSLSNFSVPISGSYHLSPRLAPPVFGLGLLEAVAEQNIVSRADVYDNDNDGISGKPNYVWDPYLQKRMLGRFGLKANTATLLTQVAAAYNNDMGITSYVFANETTHGQQQTDNIYDDPELADSILNAVKFYIQTLQVPARRNVTDPQIIRGKQIFTSAKCASCHTPVLNTTVNVAFPSLSNQRIQPFSDLLLHDMGPGLADNRADFDADGQEWRTSPLWGLGLFETVNYPAYYLHDGRARTITEAIMWHGGEASQSVNYVKQLSRADRQALLKFLKSL